MSDSRFHLKIKFEIYGEPFEWDSSLNWSAPSGECDERIMNWFVHCHDEAYNKFEDAIYAADAERRLKAEESAERAELARLQAKYRDPGNGPTVDLGRPA